jgi:hypothetical protein
MADKPYGSIRQWLNSHRNLSSQCHHHVTVSRGAVTGKLDCCQLASGLKLGINGHYLSCSSDVIVVTQLTFSQSMSVIL